MDLSQLRELVAGASPPERAVAMALVGTLLSMGTARLAASSAERIGGPQNGPPVRKLVLWPALALTGLGVARELGFDLSVLMGAAGVLGVAVSFASQTSASNVVSGFFLLLERPFAVGDTIRVGNTTGEVLSIDFLSVKLRTFENTFVRIPNETLMKSEVSNFTRFPVRRVDLQITVEANADLGRARKVLQEAATGSPGVLDEPRPQVFFTDFTDAGALFQVSVWATQERLVEVRAELPVSLFHGLNEAGLRFGFPKRVMVET